MDDTSLLDIKDRDDIPILDDNLTLFPRVLQISHDSVDRESLFALYTIAEWFKTKDRVGSSVIYEAYQAGFIQLGFTEDLDYFDFLFNWRGKLAELLAKNAK